MWKKKDVERGPWAKDTLASKSWEWPSADTSKETRTYFHNPKEMNSSNIQINRNGFSPGAPERNAVCQHLGFSPVRTV